MGGRGAISPGRIWWLMGGRFCFRGGGGYIGAGSRAGILYTFSS